ncbi:Hypothetical_protein [Hexamita inflata]|uniref:Hypothetical_protein n=1 Tax=Hexamita inflata TaxID=28002 RepID=A0AA86TW88_9EUKA|nr:Hypothetical protein HINF_LOCUS18331 [Hexamita inflata]
MKRIPQMLSNSVIHQCTIPKNASLTSVMDISNQTDDFNSYENLQLLYKLKLLNEESQHLFSKTEKLERFYDRTVSENIKRLGCNLKTILNFILKKNESQ